MNIPRVYAAWVATRASMEVEYGCAGIRLFPPEELEEAQLGFSIGPDGESLSGNTEGCWNATWLVIGMDTGVGDPIFIDASDPEPPVLTAAIGQGAWKPEVISPSLDIFSRMLDEYAAMARIRAEREELEDDDPESSAFIERIKKIDPRPIKHEFWLSMLAY